VTSTQLFVQVYAFVVGACLGSFLNVCIVRWPNDRSVLRPRSRCPRCANQLAWYENIPIVSWLVLRGRCRCCDEPISAMYPLIELAVACGWLAAIHYYGLTFTAVRLGVFATILLGVAMTDAQHYLIPDGFTLFGLIFALATSVFAFLRGETLFFATPYDAVVGACAGAGMIAIVGWIGEIMAKREAMGLGDVTLMAFVGAALGPQKALITVFVGAMLGAITFAAVVVPVSLLRRGPAREQTELALGTTPFVTPLVPFGVFLAPAALLTLFLGDALLAWLTRS
jgi:leader peptidase (prepilin peptidase) / N-methyltransferase